MEKDKSDKDYKIVVMHGEKKIYIQNCFVGKPEDDEKTLEKVADIILGNKR